MLKVSIIGPQISLGGVIEHRPRLSETEYSLHHKPLAVCRPRPSSSILRTGRLFVHIIRTESPEMPEMGLREAPKGL